MTLSGNLSIVFKASRIQPPVKCASKDNGCDAYRADDKEHDTANSGDEGEPMPYAELKALDSMDPETGYDLEAFVPTNPERFGIEITANIGLRGEVGADLFSIIVCTPQWLSEQSFEKGFLWGAHYLFVTRWDLSVVRRAITDMCRHTEGPDWAAIATKLSRYGYWEFEDYRESM